MARPGPGLGLLVHGHELAVLVLKLAADVLRELDACLDERAVGLLKLGGEDAVRDGDVARGLLPAATGRTRCGLLLCTAAAAMAVVAVTVAVATVLMEVM